MSRAAAGTARGLDAGWRPVWIMRFGKPGVLGGRPRPDNRNNKGAHNSALREMGRHGIRIGFYSAAFMHQSAPHISIFSLGNSGSQAKWVPMYSVDTPVNIESTISFTTSGINDSGNPLKNRQPVVHRFALFTVHPPLPSNPAPRISTLPGPTYPAQRSCPNK